jgi:hypothetical protein
MNQPTRKRLQLVGIAGLVLTVALLFVYRSWDRHEMLRVTLVWGRLAPVPASARNLIITRTGNMFTRGFHVSFSAPMADVETWLHESPGTREATLERPSAAVRRFLISPGGGAQHAEVTVDGQSGGVRIYVYWS